MLTIENKDIIPTSSLQRRRSCASPLLLIDGFSRRSCSYNKLPQEPLRLSILKLDGSSFEIQVSKSATVTELKQAIEDVFSHLPKKGVGKISWSHVWGHFCLCYDGQKLVTEDDHIRDFGIQDGDQLNFIHHVAINYNLIKRRSKKRDSFKQQRMSSLRSNSANEKEQQSKEVSDCGDQEEMEHHHYFNTNDSTTVHHESKLINLLRGWLSYSRLASVGERRSQGKARPLGFFSSVRRVIKLYRNKPYSQEEKCREE